MTGPLTRPQPAGEAADALKIADKQHAKLEDPLRALIGAASLWELVALGAKARQEDYDGLRIPDLAGIAFLAEVCTDLAETVRAIYDSDGTGWIVGAAFRCVEMGEAAE